MVIIHVYGAIAVLLLFCDHQDTEYESCEIEMSISQPIFTQEKKSKALRDKYIHTKQNGRKILWQFFIFMEI